MKGRSWHGKVRASLDALRLAKQRTIKAVMRKTPTEKPKRDDPHWTEFGRGRRWYR